MQSKARTVTEYLDSLPPDRRSALAAVRKVIRANLDKDFEEGMQYGMIGYCVPHRIFPAGYHCDPQQPLPFAGLASQKQHMALYLSCLYGGDGKGGEAPELEWFRKAWVKSGKKLDMGKACVRFKRLEDIPLDVVGELLRRVPAKLYVQRYEAERARLAAHKSKPEPSRGSKAKAAQGANRGKKVAAASRHKGPARKKAAPRKA